MFLSLRLVIKICKLVDSPVLFSSWPRGSPGDKKEFIDYFPCFSIEWNHLAFVGKILSYHFCIQWRGKFASDHSEYRPISFRRKSSNKLWTATMKSKSYAVWLSTTAVFLLSYTRFLKACFVFAPNAPHYHPTKSLPHDQAIEFGSLTTIQTLSKLEIYSPYSFAVLNFPFTYYFNFSQIVLPKPSVWNKVEIKDPTMYKHWIHHAGKQAVLSLFSNPSRTLPKILAVPCVVP